MEGLDIKKIREHRQKLILKEFSHGLIQAEKTELKRLEDLIDAYEDAKYGNDNRRCDEIIASAQKELRMILQRF
jgi:hypothetical protein